MTGSALEIVNLSFRWPHQADGGLVIPELHVGREEKVLLFGPSGSGKTTLLSLIGGIVSPQKGKIRVAGTDLSELSARYRDRYRAENVGIIFQQFNLLPYAKVSDNIALPLRFAPERRARVQNVETAIRDLCASLALPEGIEDQPAHRLSVGQQQRVAVARALIGTPALVLADEPTSALDANSQARFLDLLFGQVTQAGSALIMVSHDERLAGSFDRVIRIEDIVPRTQVYPCS